VRFITGEKMKSCSVTLKKNHFIVICMHPTQAGGHFGSDPMIKIERNIAAPIILGEAVIKVLEAPQRILPVPIDFKAASEALLKFEGFKSQRESSKATELTCDVDEINKGKLQITPYPIKEKGGFLPDTEKRVFCEHTADGVGKALFQVFGLREGCPFKN
jgi:hypothetical protein